MAIMFRIPQKKSRMNPPRILFSVRLLTTLPASTEPVSLLQNPLRNSGHSGAKCCAVRGAACGGDAVASARVGAWERGLRSVVLVPPWT